MPKVKNMNNLINVDDDILKSDEDSKKVKQNIFEGKQTKKPVPKKKTNNKYK
tara:strand:- start:471 stop:626 length:156 start_codon:yes stop_codon:yes gene_type:complete